jgi:hypothetical protein
MHKWIIILSLLVSSTALAEEPEPVSDIPPGVDQIEVLTQGKAAPFTGQLFGQDTALRWANWLVQYRTRLVQDVKLEQKICAAQLSYEDKIRVIEADKSKQIDADLRARILKVEKYNAKLNDSINHPSFFRSMEFGLILGVAGSVAVAVAVGVTAHELN